MKYKVVSSDNIYEDQIIDILYILDQDPNESKTTADMARDLFIEDKVNVSDREALKIFYKEITDEVSIAIDKNEVIGFSSVMENDPFFKNGGSNYYPNLAVTYSGVLPEYQRKGIWKNLRKQIENKIVPNYDVDYVVSAVSKNNKISQKANESIGMEKVGEIGDDEDETTYMYAKKV